MLLIKNVTMEQSIFLPDQYAESGLPEIAVAGRSNAGKSSLINALCRQGIARVSQQPGKTRSINAYRINGAFMLMDLPGYGYARRSAQEQERWRALIEGYFQQTRALVHLLLLCDIRHDPSEGDLSMVRWLEHYEVPFTLVATKADKIAKTRRAQFVAKLAKQVGNPPAIGVSARSGIGLEGLLTRLEEILNEDERENH
jgi:GTP-binding protein